MRPSPDPRQFALNPAHYGLPTRADFVALRIWDIENLQPKSASR